jgi:uncharacterized protein YPO0396
VPIFAVGPAAFLFGFINPRLLYRFENFFATARVVVVKPIQIDDPVVQIGKADRQRIDVRELVVERFGNRANVRPLHLSAHLRWRD